MNPWVGFGIGLLIYCLILGVIVALGRFRDRIIVATLREEGERRAMRAATGADWDDDSPDWLDCVTEEEEE